MRIYFVISAVRSHEGAYQPGMPLMVDAVEIKQYISFSHRSNDTVLRLGGKEHEAKNSS